MITQIGKQLATQIVDTVHDVCGHDINFINRNGIIYASTNTSRIGSFHEIGKKAADTKTVIEVQDNDHWMRSANLLIWQKKSPGFLSANRN